MLSTNELLRRELQYRRNCGLFVALLFAGLLILFSGMYMLGVIVRFLDAYVFSR